MIKIFNRNKPKHQHPDPDVRLEGLQELDSSQYDILADVYLNDDNEEVRRSALAKLTDLPTLRQLLESCGDSTSRNEVGDKIEKMLCNRIIAAEDALDTNSLLTEISTPDYLKEIAYKARHPAIRAAAIKRINDEEILYFVTTRKCGKEVAKLAIDKINNKDLLEKLSITAGSKFARNYAAEKIIDAASSQHPSEEALQSELEALVDKAVKTSGSINWKLAEQHLHELDAEWLKLNHDKSHFLRRQFEDARAVFIARRDEYLRIQAEKEKKQKQIDNASEQCQKICKELEELMPTVEDDRQKLVNDLQTRLNTELSELEDDNLCHGYKLQFENLKNGFDHRIIKLSEEQTEADKFTKELEAIEAAFDPAAPNASRLIDDLHKRLASCNFQIYDTEDLSKRIRHLQDIYLQYTADEREKKEAEISNALEQKKSLCLELEPLVEHENRIQAEQQVKQLQEKWQTLSSVTGNRSRELDATYQKLIDRFYEIQNRFYDEKNWQQWANKTLKEELCNKVESLSGNDDLQQVVSKVIELQAEWKNVGPAPKNVEQKLWNRFHSSCESNFERCRPFLEERDKIAAECIRTKEEMCHRAESLAESENFRETSRALKKMQQKWKELPQIPLGQEKELYKRFRTACNHFFKRNKEFLQQQDEEREANYNNKVKLCEELEEIIQEPTPELAGIIIKMQKQWKAVGPAPRSKEQEIWQRFRNSCNTYFSWLDGTRSENLQAKEKLLSDLEECISHELHVDNISKISATVKELQKKWLAAGPVPIAKRDEIENRFQQKCDIFFDKRREAQNNLTEIYTNNLNKKEDILSKAEEALTLENHKQISDILQNLQKEWKNIGPASPPEERQLTRNFQELCNSFFQEQRIQYKEMAKQRAENLKQKEALCFQLEKLAGISASKAVSASQQLNLAEQFKLAMESNFMMSGSDSSTKQIRNEEMNRIKNEWEKVGPAPAKEERALRRRYHKALDMLRRK